MRLTGTEADHFWVRVSRDALALLVILVPVVASLIGVITQPHTVLYGHDVNQHYNWETFVRFALGQGRLPLWNPFVLSGFPALADFQTGTVYPLSMLLRFLPINQLLVWNVALHMWIGGAGAYFLCRHLGASRVAATLAGIGFGLSGVMTGRIVAGNLHFLYGTAWLPLAMLFAIRSAPGSRWLPHPALVVILALQYLPGYVQIFVYTLGVVGLYAVWAAVTDGSSQPLVQRLFRAVVQVVITVALVIGVAAIQLFPALRLIPEMGRTAGIDYAAATRYSLDARDLISVVFPRAFADMTRAFHEDSGALLWEKVSYVGLALPLLAAIGLLAARRRSIVVFFGVLAIGSLLLAFGQHLPFYQLHYQLFSGFRYPGRLMALWSLAIVVLGAVGFDTLTFWARERITRRRAWIFAGAVAAIAACAIAGELAKSASPAAFSAGLVLGTSVVVVLATVLAVAAVVFAGPSARWRGAASAALVLVLAADMTAFASPFVVGAPEPRHEDVAAALVDDEVGRVLTACEEGFSPYRMTNALVPMVDGMNTAFLKDYALFAVLARGDRVPSSFRQHPTIWLETPRRFDLVDVLNVTHVVNCTPLNMDRFQPMGRVDGLYVYRNTPGLPRAYWTCQADFVDSEEAAIRLLGDRQRDARSRTVLMSQAGGARPDLTGCQHGARIDVLERDTPTGDLVVQVDATSRGVLFMSEVQYPERHVWVDGVEVQAMQANLAFMAVPLDPGLHRVEVHFRPLAFMVGAAVTAATMLFLVGLLLWRTVYDRRREALSERDPVRDARPAVPAGG